MTKIEFLVSVDGSEPKPIDVQQVAEFARVILLMRSPASFSPPMSAEPTRSETPAPPARRSFPPVPPLGERSIDYAVKAAAFYEGASFTLHELLVRMEEGGWKTRSETVRDKVNVVRATVRERADFVNQGEGRWTYEPKEQNSPSPDSQ